MKKGTDPKTGKAYTIRVPKGTKPDKAKNIKEYNRWTIGRDLYMEQELAKEKKLKVRSRRTLDIA